MGNRIAKFDGEDTWVVYQSVTEAAFEPLFHDELSANLFAWHLSRVGALHPDWKNDYQVGEDIIRFVRLSYGGGDNFADGEVYLDEVQYATSSGRRGEQILDDLQAAFQAWRKDKTAPVQVRQLEVEPD